MLRRHSVQQHINDGDGLGIEDAIPVRVALRDTEDRHLSGFAMRTGLDAAARIALSNAALPPRRYARAEYILRSETPPSCLMILAEGAARARRSFRDGNEQILAVHVAGDALNPGDILLGQTQCSVCALATATVVPIPIPRLLDVMRADPSIMRALWSDTAMQSAIQREWIVGLGRRAAHARLAHFLCELSFRLQLGEPPGAPAEILLPLTQRELADTLGLSAVHVNRMLQLLRARRLIEFGRNRLVIRNRQALYDMADFDPGYLVPPREAMSNVL